MDLRDFGEAMEVSRAALEGQIVAGAVCFLESNPELNMAGIIKFLKKRWGVEASSFVGDSNTQQIVTFGLVRMTFEPVKLDSGSPLPEQIIPGECCIVPEYQVGSILVTASTSDGGAASSLSLSQAILALISTCRQISEVYWMSSELLLSKADIKRRLDTNYRELEWPVDIWVSSHAFANEEGDVIGYTVGLGKLGGVDFEATNAKETPGRLKDRLDGVACYVVSHFGQIQNGDILGEDEYEQIKLKKVTL